MRGLLQLIALLALVLECQFAGPSSEQIRPYRELIQTYCFGCHNDSAKTGGLTLQSVDLTHVAGHADVWEKVIGKLESNAMPPPGAPKPADAECRKLILWLEASIDAAAARNPDPGRMVVHRLNRSEYVNSIRDLLDIDIDGASLLPPDDSGFGFDNIADVLSISPMLTERYLSAARKVSRQAVGDPTIRPTTQTFAINKFIKQDDRAGEDLPFGSRGGVGVRYFFPVDAEYVVKISLLRTYEGFIRGLAEPHQLEVRLEGKKIRQFTVGGGAAETGGRSRTQVPDPEAEGAEVRFFAKAGPGVIAVDYLKEISVPEGMLRPTYAVTSYEYAGDVTVPPGIGSIDVRGPYNVTSPGNSPSRQRIFVCHPADAADEDPCAKQILSALARHAYRRAVTPDDIQPLMSVFRMARANGNFDSAVRLALERILVSPDFLFRLERDRPNVAPGVAYRISDPELASRLSFFLWSSIPDEELLSVAQKGKLHEPHSLQQQVRRMMADSRFRSFVDNFTGQWLYVRNVRLITPDPYTFPDFDANLRDAFAEELELFLNSQVREDHSVLDLLNANYTFVNERLARHYGIPGVYGSHFRRVELNDQSRYGLLGKAGILMVTSYPNRTSPVLRGKWLLQNILGTPPPAPPPNVPALPGNDPGSKPLSVRERLEAHRRNPACASCHRTIDPLGFALENFDAVGAWQVHTEAGTPVDASGTLADGTKVNGPVELSQALLRNREAFVQTVIGKMLTYSLGRGTEYFDGPAIRQILRAAASDNYRWSAILMGIAESAPFQMRISETPSAMSAPTTQRVQ